MIEIIRNAANSIAAKLLLGLLVLSFVVWGVGGWLRSGQYTAVAEVEDREIGLLDYRREFQQQLAAFRGAIDLQTARAMGLEQMVLGSMLRRTALDLEAQSLGLSAPDPRVAEFIRTAPRFAAPGGAFEETRYEFFLANQGMRRGEFETQVRRDITRDLLLRSVAQGAIAPRIAFEQVWLRANERRDLAYAIVSPAAVDAPPAPSEQDLAAFHEAQAERFTAPEYRTVRLLWLRAEDRAEPDLVAEDRIRARYDARGDEFNRPERRNLEQIVFDEEAEAVDAAARLANGEAFEKIAEDRGLSADDVALGYVAKSDLEALRPEVAEQAFGETDSGAVGPIETPTGWTVINIRGRIPAVVTPFDEARDALAREIAIEDARSDLADAANAIEDLRAAGASFEEIAEKEDVVLKTVTLDRSGLDEDGKQTPDLPRDQALLTRTFELEIGEEMDLEELPSQEFYAVEIAEVTPAALRPLDTVRERVEAAWTASKRREAAAAKASELVEAIQSGEAFAAAVEAAGLSIATVEGVLRAGESAPLPTALIEAAFDAEIGAPLNAEIPASDASAEAPAGAHVVAVVRAVEPAAPEDGEAAIDAQANAAGAGIEADMANLFAAAALSEREATTNPQAVEAALIAGPGGAHQGNY